MKLSVALCTYNGEKFLKLQLNSILQQTLEVSEIVICDDGSTDKTHEILFEYEKKHPGIFKIHINENNLQSVKNFEKAISLCSGDIIFLSDQDDIWEQNKVEIFMKHFDENPSINSICSNGIVIDEEGKPLDKMTIWEIPTLLQNTTEKVDYFSILAFIENIATGAGMAFRNSLKEKILPIPIKKGFHHDEWIALLSAYENGFMMIPEKLFRYRIHSDQQVGGVIYDDNEAEKNRLVKHFNLFSEEKTFSQYKKFLKRLSQSYSKHRDLALDSNNKNNALSQKIMQQSKELFLHHQKKMKQKYPSQFFVLSLFDIFSKKRQIE